MKCFNGANINVKNLVARRGFGTDMQTLQTALRDYVSG